MRALESESLFSEVDVDHSCSACRWGTMRRSTRHGWKERLVWSVLGYYPWRCRLCKHRELHRDRGDEKDLALRHPTRGTHLP